MAEAFIGYNVHVELANGSSLEGTVSHIDSHTQHLTLKDVNVKHNGRSQQCPLYGVAGTDIKDLRILSSISTSNARQPYHAQSNANTFDNGRPPSKSTTPAPNNIAQPILAQSQAQPSTTYPNSPFSDPAIISYSPAPNQQSYPSSSPYGISSRASSPYVNLQQQHIGVHVPTKISKTTSTGDSDSKGDEEEATANGYEENSKHTVNGNHIDSSGIESDVASYSNKKSSRRRKNQNSNGQYQNSRNHPSPARKFRRGRRQTHEWAGGDVNDFKSEEFDFQGNLDLFDKEKVFAEIRELDSTAPENLLVNINRNPNYRMNHRNGNHSNQNSQTKLASHENVLEVSTRKSKFYHTDEEDETANDGEVDSDGSWKKMKKTNGGDHRKVKIRTLTGVACPTVQPLQMVEVERIAALETGPNEDQMIENAGRGASMMCLQALGGSRRIQPNNHNAAPLVVILAGNNKTGTYGLATARHLANHGCQVIVCVVGKEKDLLKSVAFQQKILLPTSGKIVKTVSDLPQQFTNPVDLIVDALLGYQFTLRDIVDEHDKRLICDLMEWANTNKAPVLSLDMPSGVNGNTGSPVNSAHYIHPKWTLCLGAPKSGCKSRTVTGELFLADIGVPRVCWKRIGVKGWGMPWGSEYLVGLEYYST